jgi:hypothetical protein
MKYKVENVRSSSMLPNTWTITIFTSLKYFDKVICNTLEIEGVIHNQVKEFTRIGNSMVEQTFAFMVHLKMLHCNLRVIKERMDGDIILDFCS